MLWGIKINRGALILARFKGYPDQKRRLFTLANIRRTLAVVAPRAGLEGSIYAGLENLTEQILGRGEWTRDDGAQLRITRCLMDANWGRSTNVVYQFCRQSKYAMALLPAHGRAVGATNKPLSEYSNTKGDLPGDHWRIPKVSSRRAVGHVLVDANYWKSFIYTRLGVSMGDPGCLSLFGDKPYRLFAQHIVAEYSVQVESRGRLVDEWKLKTNKPDNHWLDCLVGCAAAASIQGVSLGGIKPSGAAGQE